MVYFFACVDKITYVCKTDKLGFPALLGFSFSFFTNYFKEAKFHWQFQMEPSRSDHTIVACFQPANKNLCFSVQLMVRIL